jgi:FkbM family methyltransferase
MLKQRLRRSVYGLADVVTLRRGIRRRINGEEIRLAPDVARYYPGTYEPSTHAFIAQHTRPGSVAIDAGAHIGLFTVTMARAVGPHGTVLSFEPTATNASVLRRTVSLNGLDDVVECREEALAAARGTAEFYVDPHDASNANSLVVTDRSVRSVRVPTMSVDDLAARHDAAISCIKIDVEGAELDVLRGAGATLQSQRPALALDVHPVQVTNAGGSVEAIWDLLAAAGYDLHVDGAPADRGQTVARAQIFELQAVAPLPSPEAP